MPNGRRLLLALVGVGLILTGLPLPSQAAVATPQVADLGAWIDPYQPWDSTEGTTCSNVVQPGVTATISLLRRTYPDFTGFGTLRSCSSTMKSGHEEGRALDWMLNASNSSQRAVADGFLAWLLAPDARGNQHAMARRLGLMYIIWNGKMWRAYDSDPAKPWRTYTGSSPHTDHIHFSFGWDGALARTSYFIGGGCLPDSPACPVTRLAGSDRYGTAVAIAKALRPTGSTVVLASGESANLVDGLVGAPLAAVSSAPLLLTRRDLVPDVTMAELRRRAAATVIVLGGPAAVSDDVVTALEASGMTVRRLSGPDRYGTAEAIAREILARTTVRTHLFVAPAWDSQRSTALLLGGVASRSSVPILLSRGDYVPSSTAAVIAESGVGTAYAVSSGSPFPDSIVAALPGGQRINAGDAATLSTTVAQRFAVGATSSMVASAASTNVVDALPGGAAGQPVLLTATTTLSTPLANWLSGSAVAGVRVLGGTGAVPDTVARQVALYVS